MTTKFDRAFEFLIEHEGGYVNHEHDNGGATNYGISLRFLKLADEDINGDGDIDVTDVKHLSKNDAKALYRKHWWNKYNYDLINDADMAAKVLDTAVLMGPRRAHRMLQIAINRLREKPIAVDGILGPQTFGAINHPKDMSINLIKEYREVIAHYLQNLVYDNPQYQCFKIGWIARAYD